MCLLNSTKQCRPNTPSKHKHSRYYTCYTQVVCTHVTGAGRQHQAGWRGVFIPGRSTSLARTPPANTGGCQQPGTTLATLFHPKTSYTFSWPLQPSPGPHDQTCVLRSSGGQSPPPRRAACPWVEVPPVAAHQRVGAAWAMINGQERVVRSEMYGNGNRTGESRGGAGVFARRGRLHVLCALTPPATSIRAQGIQDGSGVGCSCFAQHWHLLA